LIKAGNSSNLSEPVRVIFGHRVVKDQDIVEFTIQVNIDHPERGSVTVTTIGCEGPVSAVTNIQLNNIPVDASNYKLRLGTVQQPDTTVIPVTPIPNFSSRHVTTAVQKGDFRGAAASGLSVRSTIDGLNNIRIYTGLTSFNRGFTTNPAWCLLEALTNRRWGMGIDVARLNIQDFLDLANWFNEIVGFQNADGTRSTSTRAAFNAEWRGRKAQDQLRDFCLYRRVSLPFPFEGKLRIIKLDQEVLDQNVPVFTDRFSEQGSRIGGRGSVFRNILPGQDGISSADWREIPIDQQVNRIIFKFDDATLDDMAERPLLFEDLPAQRAAGKAAGDNTLLRVQKEHFGTGITDLGEAVRQGNILMDLGEFDEGGLVNPISGSFTTSLLDALTLHPYKVIQVDSYKFDRMKAKYGFQYFRVMKIRQNSDLTVSVDIQAYPDAYYAQLEDDTTGTTVRTGGSGTPTGGGPTGGGGGPAGGPGFRPKPIKFAGEQIDDDGLTFILQLL